MTVLLLVVAGCGGGGGSRRPAPRRAAEVAGGLCPCPPEATLWQDVLPRGGESCDVRIALLERALDVGVLEARRNRDILWMHALVEIRVEARALDGIAASARAGFAASTSDAERRNHELARLEIVCQRIDQLVDRARHAVITECWCNAR